MHEARALATDAPPDSAVPPGDAVVRRLDPTADAQWDAGLAACPGASFFHTAAWPRVLQSAYGFKPVYFTVGGAGRPRSLLPLMEVDSWLTGRRGISLPFTDECAPLCANSDAFRLLHREALDYAKVRGWKYLEFRGGRSLFGDAPASATFLGHRLDLRGGEAAVFARFDGPARRAVRKAEQSGLTIEFSRDLAAVRAFHRLLCKTRKRHGVPPQPFHFFAGIQRHILAPNLGWVVLARHRGIPVAGAVYFHFGKTLIYKYGASDESFQHLRANNLVMWEAIKRHAQEGFEMLDFGRTSPMNEGLRKFKLSWGTTEHRIDYVRQDRRTGGFAAARADSPDWHARFFKMLPNPVLRLIGAVLYKHVA